MRHDNQYRPTKQQTYTRSLHLYTSLAKSICYSIYDGRLYTPQEQIPASMCGVTNTARSIKAVGVRSAPNLIVTSRAKVAGGLAKAIILPESYYYFTQLCAFFPLSRWRSGTTLQSSNKRNPALAAIFLSTNLSVRSSCSACA